MSDLNPIAPSRCEINNSIHDLGPPTIPITSSNVHCSDMIDPDSDEAIDIVESAEEESEYRAGQGPVQFYPLRIGETLNQRYRIDHQISHGGFSVVWFAHDLKTQNDVAIKVMGSGPCTLGAGMHEYHIQNDIRQAVKDTSHLVLYQDVFILQVENSTTHYVLVYPFLGPSLDPYEIRTMPLALRMSIAKQLLQELEGLHKAGFIHRDLNLQSDYGPALERPNECTSWRLGELVLPLKFSKEWTSETIYLADFGLSMKAGDSVIPTGCPPRGYASPERLHNATPTFSCDMWSYMYIFSQLYLGGFLMSYQVQAVIETMGPLPEYLRGKYLGENSKDEWYDQSVRSDPNIQFEKALTKYRPEISSAEKALALSVFTRGFSVIPEQRLTASQLLQDPDFNALIDLNCR